MRKGVTLEEVVARLEAMEEWVLGQLDPIARDRYLHRIETVLGPLARRGVIFSPPSEPE